MTEIKFKTIVKISKKIKTYVEKETKLPGKVTVDNATYTIQDAAYLISKAVQNPGKSVKLIKCSLAPKPSGETVDLKLTQTSYQSLAKKLSNFMSKKENKRLPNYLSGFGKKIKQRVFIYSFAKIIVFYDTEGRLPKTCGFKTSEVTKKATSTSTSSSAKKASKKKHGHATKHGCDNMGQNNSVKCGPHSMQEVIRNLTGKVIKQSTLASWAGTTSSGTDHQGLETAIAKASKQTGVKLTCKWYNFSSLGWSGINKILKSSNKDCIIHNLYRNKWGHYEVINRISGSNVKVQNSLGDKCNGGCYCGYVEDRSTSEFKSYINGISQKSVLVITRS